MDADDAYNTAVAQRESDGWGKAARQREALDRASVVVCSRGCADTLPPQRIPAMLTLRTLDGQRMRVRIGATRITGTTTVKRMFGTATASVEPDNITVTFQPMGLGESRFVLTALRDGNVECDDISLQVFSELPAEPARAVATNLDLVSGTLESLVAGEAVVLTNPVPAAPSLPDVPFHPDDAPIEIPVHAEAEKKQANAAEVVNHPGRKPNKK